MEDPNHPFVKAYREAEKIKKEKGIPISIHSISIGEDDILDEKEIEKLKINGGYTAIAVYRDKKPTRFELMDLE